MKVTVTPRTEALIQERLASGRYASADEVVETAIMLLEARDQFERLRASLIEAEDQIREGKVLEWTPELRQRLREEAAEMARLGIPPILTFVHHDPAVGPRSSTGDSFTLASRNITVQAKEAHPWTSHSRPKPRR